jgi:hypothetical protein
MSKLLSEQPTSKQPTSKQPSIDDQTTNDQTSSDKTQSPKRQLVEQLRKQQLVERLREQKVIQFNKLLDLVIAGFKIYKISAFVPAKCGEASTQCNSMHVRVTHELDEDKTKRILDLISIGDFKATSTDLTEFEDLRNYAVIVGEQYVNRTIVVVLSTVNNCTKRNLAAVNGIINASVIDDEIVNAILILKTRNNLNSKHSSFHLTLFEKYITKKHLIVMFVALRNSAEDDMYTVQELMGELQLHALVYEGLLESSRSNEIADTLAYFYRSMYVKFIESVLHLEVIPYPDNKEFKIAKASKAAPVSDEHRQRVLNTINLAIFGFESTSNDWSGLSDLAIVVKEFRPDINRNDLRGFCKLKDLRKSAANRATVLAAIEQINDTRSVSDNEYIKSIQSVNKSRQPHEFHFELHRKHMTKELLIALTVIRPTTRSENSLYCDSIITTLNRYALAYEEVSLNCPDSFLDCYGAI